MAKQKRNQEMFFWKKRQRADAELHNPILDDGDHKTAHGVGRKVAKRLGLSDEDCNALGIGGSNADETR
jgi:hypothetical protein